MRKLTLLFVFLLTSLAGYSQDDAILIRTSTLVGGGTAYVVKKGNYHYGITEGDNYASLQTYYDQTALYDENENLELDNIPNQLTYNGITYPVTKVTGFLTASGLKSIKLPEGIVEISDLAFLACPKLESITIPSTVNSILYYAFMGCKKLDITIGENVTTIGRGVCAGVKSISVDANNSKYDSRNNCNCIIETSTNKLIAASNTGVTIPSTVTCLGINSFEHYAETSIVIPNNVETIEAGCFNMSKLTDVTIPASVKQIDECITSSCDDIASITVDANNPVYDSRGNCNAIIETKTNKLISGCKNTIIPEGVTVIGKYAMDVKLTEITIPATVASIEEEAFRRIEKPTELTTVTSKILNPFPISDVFCYDGGGLLTSDATVTLKVPKGTKDKYAATAGWNVFSTIVEDDALGTVSTSAADEVNYVEKADQTVAIVSNESTNASVEIPDAVGGKEVSEIGANAFVGMTTVTDIYLPETEEKLELGINALKIDDDHIATIHVPLSLLGAYALDEQLKQNYEAGMVVATITAPNKYWTFSSSVNVVVPEGVSVYICKSINGSDISIVELTDEELTVGDKKVIKANNGVLISSVSGNAYDLVANAGEQASGTPPATGNANSYPGNKLVPVVVTETYDSGEYYMLYEGEFVCIKAGDTTKTPAGRALLKK